MSFRPAREEVLNVVAFIHDSLVAAELMHVTEQDDDNPDLYMIGCHDEDNYVNVGYVGWDDGESRVRYFAYDPARAKRDVMEGFDEDESKCWWDCQHATIFLLHLDGSVRDIVARDRAQQLAAEARGENPVDGA